MSGNPQGNPSVTASPVSTERYIGRVGQNVLERRVYGDSLRAGSDSYLKDMRVAKICRRNEGEGKNPRNLKRAQTQNRNPRPKTREDFKMEKKRKERRTTEERGGEPSASFLIHKKRRPSSKCLALREFGLWGFRHGGQEFTAPSRCRYNPPVLAKGLVGFL